MARDREPARPGSGPTTGGSRGRAVTPPGQRTLQQLQQSVGNQATQNLLNPRGGQNASAAAPNLFPDPEHLRQFVNEQAAREERPLRIWLDAHTDELHLMSMRALVRRVRDNVPQAESLPDIQIENVIREWAARHEVDIPPISALPSAGESEIPPPPAGPSIADSEFVAAVQRVFSVVVDGVGVERAHGRFNLSASGATVGLRRGGFRAEGTLGFTGDLKIATEYQGVHFIGKLSAERWQLSLSFPSASSTPNLARVGEVFERGEAGLRAVVRAAAVSPGVGDIEGFVGAIGPHTGPIREAVRAASNIARTGPGVNFGITASGPGPAGAGAPGAASGVTVSATLTLRF